MPAASTISAGPPAAMTAQPTPIFVSSSGSRRRFAHQRQNAMDSEHRRRADERVDRLQPRHRHLPAEQQQVHVLVRPEREGDADTAGCRRSTASAPGSAGQQQRRRVPLAPRHARGAARPRPCAAGAAARAAATCGRRDRPRGRSACRRRPRRSPSARRPSRPACRRRAARGSAAICTASRKIWKALGAALVVRRVEVADLRGDVALEAARRRRSRQPIAQQEAAPRTPSGSGRAPSGSRRSPPSSCGPARGRPAGRRRAA